MLDLLPSVDAIRDRFLPSQNHPRVAISHHGSALQINIGWFYISMDYTH